MPSNEQANKDIELRPGVYIVKLDESCAPCICQQCKTPCSGHLLMANSKAKATHFPFCTSCVEQTVKIIKTRR